MQLIKNYDLENIKEHRRKEGKERDKNIHITGRKKE